MVARLMRSMWIVAIVAAATTAWLSVHLFGARIGTTAAAMAGVLSVVALHPAAIAFNFVLSRLFGDPVPARFRLSWWQAVKTFDAEIDASMRGLWFATPFLPHRPAPPASDVGRERVPILFVHGYLCNRAVWHSFMRDAAARGYRCEAVTLENPFASIDRQVGAVEQAIDDLLASAKAAGSPVTRVAIVAHSMGGLVARAVARRTGTSRVAHVVTLGTPHRGTLTARFASIPSVVQMRRGSPWIADLEAFESSGAGLPRGSITTVHSHHDEVVFPQSTGALDGAHRIEVGGVGHVSLLYDERVRGPVFERLAAIDVAESGDRGDPVGGDGAAQATAGSFAS